MSHKIVDPPIACHKKRFLTFIKFTFVKIFCLDHDNFPQDTTNGEWRQNELKTFELTVKPKNERLEGGGRKALDLQLEN